MLFRVSLYHHRMLSHRLCFTLTLNSSSSSISLRSRSFRSLSPLNFYRSISFNSSLYHSTISHDQRWTEKPQTIEGVSTSAAEAVGNAHGAVNVTGNSRKSHGQKSVWKPRSYGTVSGATTVEVEKAPMDRAIVTKQGNGTETASSEKSNPLLTKLLSGNLLQNFTVDSTTYSNAQIRATFYPKFENEKSDLEIRSRMVELVSNGKATVEVSLKHSGSLFMYAGHEGGAYAKNSFGNIYTAVGVFVLGRIFRVAWGSRASKKQSEFNNYLEWNRLCISMELVTAVLGDHGQRPREDYVVVTAVTDLGNGKPKFYSTPDIIGFCREWRLPTNHVWLFSTRKSVMSFFAAYDALCEEGTATPVCKALDEVADISVPGSADHTKVQGEILEGLVARIVTRESSNHMEQVLRDSPPPQLEGGKLDLGPSLRDIMAAHRKDEKEQIKALLESVGTSFCPSTVDWSERADAKSKDTDQAVLSKFLQANPSDFTTTKFQEMIRLMKKKNLPANFKSRYNFHKIESVTSDDIHFKMVVHVHRDATFKRYQKEMRNNPGLWPLYRGFFVDINLFKAINERAAEIAKSSGDIIKNANASNGIPGKDDLPEKDANLMIKMKFLTYKLRTFLIRNGLRLLFKDGPTAYKNYYMKQMKIWNTSAAKQKQLIRMLDEWAVHIRRKYKTELSSSMYLTELEPFLEQYAKRSPQNQALIGSAGNFIRSEDFMAIIEGGRDEEGDLEKTEEELAPSTPSPSVAKDSVRKDEGLIVFFPGIPGCAKSALCKEIVATPGGLGDDRPIQSMMGDLIKAKYWQKVAAERRKKPYSIMLADKNAPNEEVWGQIEGMCQSTKASAVPVVVESEGTETNPYSLDTLAVFIFRVLHRVNHPGKLDKACPNVGYVLLMFYHLYEGKSRWEFESELIERFGSLVKMPLLKPDRNPLPVSIKSILEEGINLFSLHSSRHGRMESTKGTYASDWAKWEKQLRDTLLKDSHYLNSIQVPFEFAVKQVTEQLRAIAKGDYERPVTERRRLGTIVFAAVCLPVTEIQSLVDNLVQRNPNFGVFLEGKNLENKLQRAHLTLAHKKSHGVTAVASYGSLLHEVVPVSMSALFFSDKLAALEAHPGTVDGEKVTSKNPWSHVTLWTAEGVQAKDASTLPQLFSEGKATRILIDPPVTITGTLEFY